jgi:hypothetical protein
VKISLKNVLAQDPNISKKILYEDIEIIFISDPTKKNYENLDEISRDLSYYLLLMPDHF